MNEVVPRQTMSIEWIEEREERGEMKPTTQPAAVTCFNIVIYPEYLIVSYLILSATSI
jgi:hypothetical protein